MLSNFHFTDPLWLLMIIPVLLLVWRLKHQRRDDSGWEGVIDPILLEKMLAGKMDTNGSGHWAGWLLTLGWTLAVIALANPVWEKKAVPLFQTDIARVIVLDLSLSMDVQDVKPSRLQRARYKIEDLLARQQEGLTGLVVFAGSAFTVSPLTRDNKTISALLKSLETSMMPTQGSRADLGLLQAGNVLEQAGIHQGDIVLVADGAIKDKAIDAVNTLAKKGYRTSVLAVGTELGAPLPNIRTRDNQPIIVPMEKETLQAIASQGGGIYQSLQSNNDDIDRIVKLSQKGGKNQSADVNNLINNNDWYANGPWLLLVILPLAALVFRRGWLLSIVLVGFILPSPQYVQASVWDDMWLRQDQQASEALRSKHYKTAEQLAVDPMTKGAAAYKQGNYQKALEQFSMQGTANSAYNKGNALAQLKQYKEAISAYEQALGLQPDMKDAKTNKAKIEALLKKQEEKKQQQKKDKENKKDKKNQKNKKQDKEDKKDKDDKGEKGKKQEKSKKDKDGKGEKDKKDKGGKGEKDKKDKGGKGEKDKKQQESKKGKEDSSSEKQDKAQDESQKDEQGKKGRNQFDDANKELAEGKKAEEKQEEAEKQAAEKEQKKKEQKKKEQEKQSQALSSKLSKVQQAAESAAKKAEAIKAESLSDEEKMAADQWLKRIPDDPGGLLRRKFRYQYQQQGARYPQEEKPW